MSGQARRGAHHKVDLHSATRTFSSFHNYNYRLYWFGQLLSVIGTWISRIAQAWLVLKLTNSAFDLGAVSALQMVPLAVFALFGGVLADRLPKRRVLICTQSVMLTVSLTLGVLIQTGAIRLWHIYALAMILGLATAFDNPTRQAFVSEMVGLDDLPNAIALNSGLFNTARIVGPAVGGALIAAFDIAVPFFVDAASFLAVIGGLLLMRPSAFHNVPKPARGPVLARLREGLSYSARTPNVAMVLIVLAFLGAFGYNFTVVLPLIADKVLGTGALGFGGLMTAMGIGSLCAALGIAYLNHPSRRLLFGGATAFTVLLGLLSVVRTLPLVVLILVPLGVASIAFSATANSRLQITAPPELRGRVMSLYILLFAGTAPVGSLLLGALAQHWGVEPAVATMAALCAVGVLLGWLYARRHPSEATAPQGEPTVEAAAPDAALPAPQRAVPGSAGRR